MPLANHGCTIRMAYGENRRQCEIEENCIDPSLPCNCDSTFPLNLTDAGNFM